MSPFDRICIYYLAGVWSFSLSLSNLLKFFQVYKQEEFARKVGLLIKDFRKPDSKMHVAHVTGKLLLYAGQHNVTLESCFVNVALSLAVMDGLGRQLKDDFNIFRAATPFLAQAAIRYARGYQ